MRLVVTGLANNLNAFKVLLKFLASFKNPKEGKNVFNLF